MAYTVNQLAKLSGVTVRTLHFYHQIGLLKPARVGANGYRLYEQEQVLRLQQILFYRELGFDLRKIQKAVGRADFDNAAALSAHREALEKDIRRLQKLVATIDKTLNHLKGSTRMKDKEMYAGFDIKRQAEHEKYLIDRFGEPMKESIAASRQRIKDWTKADWEKSTAEFVSICRELVELMNRGFKPGAAEVQRVIRRHYDWICHFWTPNRESYTGHTQLIVDSDLRQAYDPYDLGLADFLAEGIKVFAQNELE